MGYDRNLKIGMGVATNKRCKKIMRNKQWLPWLPRDIISECQNLQIPSDFYELYLRNVKRFFNSVLLL